MLSVVGNIAPVFLLIVIGFGFKRAGFPGDGLWEPAERLAYYVLLPALVVHNLAVAELDGLQLGPLAATIVAVAATLTAIIVPLRPLMRIDGAAFTSVVQGVVRVNSFLAIAVAAVFFGPPGVTVCAVFISIMMPTVNIISITALAAYSGTGRPKWTRIAGQVVTNPLIIACALGAALNGADLVPPGWVMGTLGILAKAALPVALLCVGAGLDLSIGREHKGALALTCLVKLVVSPAAAWAIGNAMGLGGLTFAVVIMFTAMPASPASYVLARQLGGAAPLMAGILTLQTAAAAITLPVVLSWLLEDD